MDKNTFLAVVLSGAIMVIWYAVFPPPEPQPREYADSFDTTRKALKTLLAEDPEKEHLLKISSAALDLAMKEVCFDLSSYEKIFKSNELHMKLARTALDNLSSELSSELA